MTADLVRTSKFLSLVLRHAPERIGLVLDAEGWASVEELIRLANVAGHRLDEATLRRVVAENDKQRFALSPDGARIRASQGHSIAVELGLPASEPPEHLYHGTARHSLTSIRERGLVPGSRQHVHLSRDARTALQVGGRHGSPVVLEIDTGEMNRRGHAFFLSQNGVWLTEHVPTAFIDFSALDEK